jgi:hypothetical protein
MSNLSKKKELRDVLKSIIEDITVEEIEHAIEEVIKERPSEPAEQFLSEIRFQNKITTHPLLRKVVDLGNLKRSITSNDSYKHLNDRLLDIIRRGKPEITDISEIQVDIAKLIDTALNFIINKQACEARKGLGNIHAPGSVAKTEALNLYFPGEKYTDEELSELALRLSSSIAIGKNLGLFSENSKLMKELKQLSSQYFGKPYRIDNLKDLDISVYESNYPFATLLGFLLWLAMKRDRSIGNERELLNSIINELKKSSIILYFIPGGEREKWKTIRIPNLDAFVNNWILDRNNRDSIQGLRGVINSIISGVRKASKRRSKLNNIMLVLMNYYESLCQRLIYYGDLDLYSMRRILDIIMEISAELDLRPDLHYISRILEPGYIS